MPPRRETPLTEADIPPPLDPPQRSSFDSQSAFDQTMAEHPAAAAARMKERRRLKEKLRDQKRDRSGRARSSVARAKETERRRNDVDAAAKHRQRPRLLDTRQRSPRSPRPTWRSPASLTTARRVPTGTG